MPSHARCSYHMGFDMLLACMAVYTLMFTRNLATMRQSGSPHHAELAPRTPRHPNPRAHKDSLAARPLGCTTDASSLVVGTRVRHEQHGNGHVVELDAADGRGKPIHVQFDNGEYHCYSAESAAAKLHVETAGARVLAWRSPTRSPRDGVVLAGSYVATGRRVLRPVAPCVAPRCTVRCTALHRALHRVLHRVHVPAQSPGRAGPGPAWDRRVLRAPRVGRMDKPGPALSACARRALARSARPCAAAAQREQLDARLLLVGTRVIHEVRGIGRVAEVNHGDARGDCNNSPPHTPWERCRSGRLHRSLAARRTIQRCAPGDCQGSRSTCNSTTASTTATPPSPPRG